MSTPKLSWQSAQRSRTISRYSAGTTNELLRRLNGEGKTVLFVTHDRELAARAARVVEIRDGVVVEG